MRKRGKAWAVMMAAFFAGIAITVNQFKVPPLLRILMTDLRLDMVIGGWLMSVFSVSAVFLSIPAALLLKRLGHRPTGLLAVGCVAAGSGLGALAANATGLLVSRIIEGISASLIAVVSPSLISLWFGPQERGLPMGIWAAWIPAGGVLMFNLAQPLEAAFGWRTVWWFGTGLALVALVFLGLVTAVPRQDTVELDSPPAASSSKGRGLLNPSNWLLAIAFGTFTFSIISYGSWVPSFLTESMYIEAPTANFYASLIFLAAIAANVLAGWIINHTPTEHRSHLLTVVFIVAGSLFFWAFRLWTESIIVPYILTLGFVSNFIPTIIFTLSPEAAARNESIGLALATVNAVSGLGYLLGPPFLGAIVGSGTWAACGTWLAAVMGVGIMSSWLAGKRMASTPSRGTCN